MSAPTRPLRVLVVAFATTAHGGVHRKLAEQVLGLRRHFPETLGVVIADTRVAPALPDMPFTLVDLPGGGFDRASRAMAFQTCWEIVDRVRPDVIYLRNPLYDAHVLRFVRGAPPVVIELQTKTDLELAPEAATAEREWARRVVPELAGLVAVTPEILEHERARTGTSVPGHVMANGADPAALPFQTPALAPDRTDLVCVSAFAHWHGLDRVICGMAMEPDVTDVHLHLVGSGEEIPVLQRLTRELALEDRVHFHGAHPPTALDSFYARAHLAIGVLAPQRKGLTELAALKHREYALRGVPFVYAGRDVDFPSTLPWVRVLPADDSPISPRQLKAFAAAWTHERRRQQVRQWAEQHLSWATKLEALATFLTQVARRDDTTPS